MGQIIDIQGKIQNIDMVEKLAITQRAVAKLDQMGLAALAVTIDKSLPIVSIETPDKDSSIRDQAQPFGKKMRMTELQQFGKPYAYVMWNETQNLKETGE